MPNTFTQSELLIAHKCSCGVHFGLPESFYNARKKDHKTFYCPNGHSRYYPGKTEEERLKEQLAGTRKWAEEDRQSLMQQRDRASRQAAAHKGNVTKLKKRAAAGMCPVCNRSFSALLSHVANQHPGFPHDGLNGSNVKE